MATSGDDRKEIVSKFLREMGRKGGSKNTKAQVAARLRNAIKARKARAGNLKKRGR